MVFANAAHEKNDANTSWAMAVVNFDSFPIELEEEHEQ